MHNLAAEIIALADESLGGLQGRKALLVGPASERCPFLQLLQEAQMQEIYEEDSPHNIRQILPQIHLLISTPQADPSSCPYFSTLPVEHHLSAATIVQGREGKSSPLVILDLSTPPSIDELVGLLPSVCLYNVKDLRHIFTGSTKRVS